MKIRTVLSIMIAGACAMIANAEPFTYQGVLNESGQPANGLYDISLSAFDSAVGGSVLGAGFTFTNVQVVDGLFELEVELGDIFDANDAWLDVSVRSAGGGFFTDLSPRTKFTSTPKAQHASVADFALNAPWTAASGVLSYGDGNDRVFINRTNSVTPATYFGVHADVSGFVGMFVSGLENSRPFYGYSAANRISAYSYFDSATSSWALWKNGDKLVVDADGDVVATQVFKSDSFEFKTPQTRYASVSGNTLSSGTGNYVVASGIGGGYMTSTGRHIMTAPVSIPHGAVVTGMTVYFADSVAADLDVRLSYQSHGGSSFNTISELNTDGIDGANQSANGTVPTTGTATVDHGTRHYHLRVFSNGWPGNSSLRVKSVRISYRVTEAD